MAIFKVEGGTRLHGSVTPQGAKNEALQIICAALLTKERVVLHNVPIIADVMQLLKEKKIDNVAYWSFFDDPGRNPANDSSYKVKGVGSMLANKRYVYELPDKVALPELEPEYNGVSHLSLKDYIKERYIGTADVNIEKLYYGTTPDNDYYIANYTKDGGIKQSFDLMHKGEVLTRIKLNVPGEHNALNAMAAITVALYLGASPQQIAADNSSSAAAASPAFLAFTSLLV